MRLQVRVVHPETGTVARRCARFQATSLTRLNSSARSRSSMPLLHLGLLFQPWRARRVDLLWAPMANPKVHRAKPGHPQRPFFWGKDTCLGPRPDRASGARPRHRQVPASPARRTSSPWRDRRRRSRPATSTAETVVREDAGRSISAEVRSGPYSAPPQSTHRRWGDRVVGARGLDAGSRESAACGIRLLDAVKHLSSGGNLGEFRERRRGLAWAPRRTSQGGGSRPSEIIAILLR